MQNTAPLLLAHTDFPSIHRGSVKTLQVNLGYLCNLSCVHCHVNAGPHRTELMSREVIDLVLDVIKKRSISTLDLTGGAPELNPHFRYLVKAARALDVEVIDRCNLTILQEEGQETLAQFLADQEVVVTASLPCYEEENVSAQRGKGVYERSIDALKQLNALGYGVKDNLPLNLVYNPVGPNLPPPQVALQADYKKQLHQQHGIVFNELFTITNMPISRFGAVLLSNGGYEDYMSLLKRNYSAANLDTVMCKDLVSVDWQGNIYDCDFNQMLAFDMQLSASTLAQDTSSHANKPPHISRLLEDDLQGQPIAIGEHCYGCTAGQGSSCGGALIQE